MKILLSLALVLTFSSAYAKTKSTKNSRNPASAADNGSDGCHSRAYVKVDGNYTCADLVGIDIRNSPGFSSRFTDVTGVTSGQNDVLNYEYRGDHGIYSAKCRFYNFPVETDSNGNLVRIEDMLPVERPKDYCIVGAKIRELDSTSAPPPAPTPNGGFGNGGGR